MPYNSSIYKALGSYDALCCVNSRPEFPLNFEREKALQEIAKKCSYPYKTTWRNLEPTFPRFEPATYARSTYDSTPTHAEVLDIYDLKGTTFREYHQR